MTTCRRGPTERLQLAALEPWEPIPAAGTVIGVAVRANWRPAALLAIAERLTPGAPLVVLSRGHTVARGNPAYDAVIDRLRTGAATVFSVPTDFVDAVAHLAGNGVAVVLDGVFPAEAIVSAARRAGVPLVLNACQKAAAQGAVVTAYAALTTLMIEPGTWCTQLPITRVLPQRLRTAARHAVARAAHYPPALLAVHQPSTPLCAMCTVVELPLNPRAMRRERELFWDVFAPDRRFRSSLCARLTAGRAALRQRVVAS